MIPQDELTVVDTGSGYVIGELPTQHKHLTYMREGALVMKFDGVDTALDFVTSKLTEPKRDKASVKTGRANFNAFDTYEEAVDTFRNHPEKVVSFDPAELRIKDANEAGTQVEFDVVGDYIDMGRYMEGVPESWGVMQNGNARNRRVNVTINLNMMWNINHEDITHRGQRVLRLIDALEAGGVRTQLVGIESTQCGHTEVILKHHDEPLTISDLAVVTHPEFLRRVVFRINEHSKTWQEGYGRSDSFSNRLTPEFIDSKINDELNLLIDANLRGISTIDRLFEQLERLLVWEMSKPVPEVSSIKLDVNGIYFQPNGARDEYDIRREGQEAINGD